ncbi:unnamed protein product [Gemmata massiliana]|uniref:Uncharacterized protein n=1 Tax=Gemmata massiliana TaxID=1210884 RepID=A0A6P2D407_9BACT|nr:hypothetical protein [Gemmata massiliana]VTR94130.1 unnamed protein product [Gemmata massiliana]
MSRFSKLRELVTRARSLEAEARRMASNSPERVERLIAAEEHRAQAEWLADRIDDDEYNARLVECLDARAFPVT